MPTLDDLLNKKIDLDTPPSEKLCKLIQRLMKEFDDEDVVSILMENTQKPRDLEKIAYIVDVSAWIASDNGAKQHRTLEGWIKGNDEDRIWVALHNEAYPFLSREEMEQELESLGNRVPRFHERCHELIQSRRKDGA